VKQTSHLSFLQNPYINRTDSGGCILGCDIVPVQHGSGRSRDGQWRPREFGFVISPETSPFFGRRKNGMIWSMNLVERQILHIIPMKWLKSRKWNHFNLQAGLFGVLYSVQERRCDQQRGESCEETSAKRWILGGVEWRPQNVEVQNDWECRVAYIPHI